MLWAPDWSKLPTALMPLSFQASLKRLKVLPLVEPQTDLSNQNS
jgi:hypothetical protein